MEIQGLGWVRWGFSGPRAKAGNPWRVFTEDTEKTVGEIPVKSIVAEGGTVTAKNLMTEFCPTGIADEYGVLGWMTAYVNYRIENGVMYIVFKQPNSLSPWAPVAPQQ